MSEEMMFVDVPVECGSELKIVLPGEYWYFINGRLEGKDYYQIMADPAIYALVKKIDELRHTIMSAGYTVKGKKNNNEAHVIYWG